MQYKCKKCGKICNIKLPTHIKVLLRRNLMCETCESINAWKKDNAFHNINRNQYTWSECIVECYDYRLYEWIEEKIISSKRYCEVKMSDEVIYNCFPISLKGDYLVCCRDEYNPSIEYGIHRKGDVEKSIPLNSILSIKILDIYKDYFEPDVQEPIYGFKGVWLKDGILKARDFIYEIDIPYEEPQRNRYHTDFQDVYSHFCLSIEDVLLHYRDFITSPISFSQGTGYGEERLFVVKGEGHCFQITAFGWVSNRLTLIREVSKEEIVKYFNERPDLKLEVDKYYKGINSIYENVLSVYGKAHIKPYNKFMSEDEIENMLIQSCEYNKMDNCVQKDKTKKLEDCKNCDYYSYHMKGKMKTYCYLAVRNAIQKGIFNETDINYEYLKDYNCKIELDSIQRLCRGYGVKIT